MHRSAQGITFARLSTTVWLLSSVVGIGFGIWISWAVQSWWLIIPASAAALGILRWWLRRLVMRPPQMNTSIRRLIQAIVAPLLIFVPIVCLGFVAFFGWAWTDSTTWGAWSKGPQTTPEHLHSFFSFMLRSYWPQILASAAAIAAGVYIWPRRRPPA